MQRERWSDDVDEAVMAAARRWDHAAFATIVQHYDRRLRVLIFALLRDETATEDVLQDVLVSAYRALPGFRGDSSLGTWLYRIAYRSSLDRIRRDERVKSLPLDEAGSRSQRSPDFAAQVSLRQELAAALATLSPQKRAVVLLVDRDGYDYRTAGEILGIPKGTVCSRLNQARAALRRALSWPPPDAPLELDRDIRRTVSGEEQ